MEEESIAAINKPMCLTDAYAIRAFISCWRIQIIPEIMDPKSAIDAIGEIMIMLIFGKIKETRRKP